MEREMCGYLEWDFNIDYLELESFTAKVNADFGRGSIPQLPVSSSIAPAVKQSSSQQRLSPSYESSRSDPLSPATLITTTGDNKDEEVESLSNSLTSSLASSALQTPRSNAEFDKRGEAGVVGLNDTVGSGVFVGTQQQGITANDAARI